jgi:hypothetical protein
MRSHFARHDTPYIHEVRNIEANLQLPFKGSILVSLLNAFDPVISVTWVLRSTMLLPIVAGSFVHI